MLIASSRPTTAQVIAFTTVGPSITARARSANNTLLNSRLSNRSSRFPLDAHLSRRLDEHGATVVLAQENVQ